MGELLVALAQIETAVADMDGNSARILERVSEAGSAGADIVVFPELCLTGYPPEDLLLDRGFVLASAAAVERIAREVGETVAVVGFAEPGHDTFNAAAVLHRGTVVCTYRKRFLPNYGVFDEKRYFGAGDRGVVLELRGVRIGITICEDMWFPGGPMDEEVSGGGAEVVLNISASPFNRGKLEHRERLAVSRSMDGPVVLAYVNAVGAQDELVFDGGSFLCHPGAGITARAPRFREALVLCEFELSALRAERMLEPRFRHAPPPRAGAVDRYRIETGRGRARNGVAEAPEVARLSPVEEIREALVLGLSRYARRNGFEKAVLGISGGIDSAVTAAIAVESLGAENVVCVFMPTRFTSEESAQAARSLAENLGTGLMTVPVEGVFASCIEALGEAPGCAAAPTVLENVQARIRGNVLMALSNAFRWLVLATGNKSELCMGYCTLYGDMAGGFALLKDLLKTQVYMLAELVNERAGGDVIPREILERAPTAELREGQLDTDTLPPYGELDPVLEAFVEKGLSAPDIVRRGFDPRLVDEVISIIDANEYKRRQAPVGVKLTSRAFGRDWRMPISVSGEVRRPGRAPSAGRT